MKVTLGVESSQHGMELINFLRALDFPFPALQLSYVLELGANTGVYGSRFNSSSRTLAAYFQQLKDEGHATLKELADYAGKQGYTPDEAKLLVGSVSNELLGFAEDNASALLVLGSSRKSPIERLVLDSASRKAAIHFPQSVLIVKGRPLLDRQNLTVVCATDHSSYSNLCLEKFFQWQPRGVHRVTVLSIAPDPSLERMPEAASWIHDALVEENDRLIAKLSKPGVSFENRVESGAVDDEIARVMQETGADLLVLGSQGHGFLERLRIASVSLEQAMNRPYPVLIMRTDSLATSSQG